MVAFPLDTELYDEGTTVPHLDRDGYSPITNQEFGVLPHEPDRIL